MSAFMEAALVVSGRARQERLGVQLTLLLEDPEGATLSRRAAAAAAAAAAGGSAAAPPDARSLWIAPAPSSIRLRLFCLPYAGGVSENVFARCAALAACAHAQPCTSRCSCQHAAVAALEPACHHQYREIIAQHRCSACLCMPTYPRI